MDTAIRIHNVWPRAAPPAPTPITGDLGSVCELLQLMHAPATDDPAAQAVRIPVRRLHTGETLFHEGARADAIHFIRGGTFKTFRTAEDGYEQVLSFAGRAEVLGFDALCMDCHPASAVALEESSVFAVFVRDLFALGQTLPSLDRAIHLAASSALSRSGEFVDLMAAVAAEVRLGRFLVQWSQRMAACGHSPRRFRLRMSRRDIASHLGVAHETVSRSFGALAGWGLVRVDNREVEILDMGGLKALSSSTRRQVDDSGRPSLPRLSLVPSAGRHARPATSTTV